MVPGSPSRGRAAGGGWVFCWQRRAPGVLAHLEEGPAEGESGDRGCQARPQSRPGEAAGFLTRRPGSGSLLSTPELGASLSPRRTVVSRCYEEEGRRGGEGIRGSVVAQRRPEAWRPRSRRWGSSRAGGSRFPGTGALSQAQAPGNLTQTGAGFWARAEAGAQ